MNSWSGEGPRLRLYTCQALFPGIAPMPVLITSPFGSTTSSPHEAAMSAPVGR
jgi:hypothetical protein